MKKDSYKRIVNRVSFVSILVNAVLTLFKLAAGIFARSSAMVSDAVHSASDVFSTFIVIIGVGMSRKASDKSHPFGHERFECVASLILAGALAAIGVGIGYDGVMKIIDGVSGEIATPGALAIVAAVVSIGVKEWMYRYTIRYARKIDSVALRADAHHHRSDALSSIGSFVGIAGAILGLPILDPAACVIICLFILKAAADIFTNAVRGLVDRACDEETEKKLIRAVLETEGVIALDSLQTRMFNERIYVNIEISADGGLQLERSHVIAEEVHDRVEAVSEKIKHCMVHVNPYQEAMQDGQRSIDECINA